MTFRSALVAVAVLGVAVGVLAQTPPAPQKTLAATLDVYVFPTQGQTPSQQSTDEAACYDWAVQNTGSDPFALEKQAHQQQQQGQQAQQATAEQVESFKKAFSVCLEAKSYMVKY